MPQRCVAGGCNRSQEGGISLHTFPKDAERCAKWVSNVRKVRLDWDGPNTRLVLCSLHFTRDCFQPSVLLSEELGLPSKKRILKSTAIPTLFPKAADIKTGSMSWAAASIHGDVLQASNPGSSSRSAVIKRKRAQVRNLFDR